MFRRLWDRLKLLWKLAVSERASPREVGWAVAIGAFAGCTPAIGFHGAVALGLATVFRKNRLFAWLGSRVCNVLTLPFVALAEVQIAHRLRTGTFVELDATEITHHARELMLDWCLGTVPVGVMIAGTLGGLGWVLANRRDRQRALAASAPAAPLPRTCPTSELAPSTSRPSVGRARAVTRSPAEPPRPSSESPG